MQTTPKSCAITTQSKIMIPMVSLTTKCSYLIHIQYKMLKIFIKEMDSDLKIRKISYFRERKSMNKEYIKK